MNEKNLTHKLRIFDIVILNTTAKTANPRQKRFYIQEKNLRTRNCRRKFIKHLPPEKCKENM